MTQAKSVCPMQSCKKPDKLNAEEWIIMKRHPRIGHDILSKSQSPVFQLGAEIVLYHHERYDGSGYPNGIAGDARIVADVFDALSMRRPYKQLWSMSCTLFTLQELAEN